MIPGFDFGQGNQLNGGTAKSGIDGFTDFGGFGGSSINFAPAYGYMPESKTSSSNMNPDTVMMLGIAAVLVVIGAVIIKKV